MNLYLITNSYGNTKYVVSESFEKAIETYHTDTSRTITEIKVVAFDIKIQK